MSDAAKNCRSEAESEPLDRNSPTDFDLELGQADSVPISAFEEVSELEQLKSELADAEKRILLAQADLDNFRRRMRKEMQDQLKFASTGLITELLESVDNLGRAIDTHQPDANSAGLVQGMKMVFQQLSQTLQTHGCKKIEAIGQPFDPNLHQAVQMQPSADVPPNTVLADLRPGFMLHDRVIRPSQVAVSSAPQSQP
jgi:molecular chaperone GrpE